MTYKIFLHEKQIGISLLDKADAPMGIVSGNIISTDNSLTYSFISNYCKDNGIEATEYPEEKLINTQAIPSLKVFNENGVEIKGEGTTIEGMDSDGFEINIFGIPYPFYEEQFPHHVKDYKKQFE